jgi:hypothetical protein
MDRNATLRLTDKDKQAARAAILDSTQGAVRRDGGL